MTSDCYAILGVTPTAEDVVIGAAYRALMRHYHPDTNPDPRAQARAQEISAAYAVLRDPVRRAEYDALRRAQGIFWHVAEPPEPPPPMRAPAIATALLAVALVGAVWAWPRPAVEPGAVAAPVAQRNARPPAEPPVMRAQSPAPAELPPLRPPPGPSPPELAEVEPAVAPPSRQLALAGTARRPSRIAPSPAPAKAVPATASAVLQPKAAAPDPKPAADEQVAALTKMSAGFFSQSMVHASAAKKEALLAARDRSAAQRKACRSDACVADSYVREIRETSAIMEGRPGPK